MKFLHSNVTKIFLGALAVILLLTLRPQIPPQIPPATIRVNTDTETGGTLPVAKLYSRLAICEKRIIYREFSAAVFVSMEKK